MTLLQILLPPIILFSIVFGVSKLFNINFTKSSSNDDGFIDGFMLGQFLDED